MTGADSTPGPPWRAGLVCAAGGVLHALAIAPRALWWLQIAAVAVLYAAMRGRAARQAAGLGFVFGLAWLCSSVWWLFISMHRFGGLPATLAALAVLLLAAALSSYLALAMALFSRRAVDRPWADAAAFSACWLLAECARALLFTGFPWAASGYAHVDGPLAALAPWIGVYGIGAVAAALAALVAQALGARPEPRLRHAGLAATAVAVCGIAGWAGAPAFTTSTGSLNVGLVQTNVSQDEKFALERMPETLDWLARTLGRLQADLIVAPETAVPLLPEQLQTFAPDYWPALLQTFNRPDRAALVGVPLGDERSGYTNSVVGLAGGVVAYRYDKSHLVPFGEFIPTGFRWFTELMNIPLGDFSRGPLDAASFEFAGQRLAPNICYEDLFGEELARRFTDAARAPTVLVNIGNIGWFGDTIAVVQHLNISRLRALELQRPMIRATNTGATAVIDHLGRVQARLAPFTRDTLSTRVEGRQGSTPYAAWAGRLGLWPLVGAAVLYLLAWHRQSRHPSHPSAPPGRHPQP